MEWLSSIASLRGRPAAGRGALDADTGKPYWTHEIKGDAWASPLVADGKAYLGTRSGTFYVFAASKEKKVISETNLGSSVYGTAVVANGMVFIQSNTHLFAFSNGAAKVPRPD